MDPSSSTKLSFYDQLLNFDSIGSEPGIFTRDPKKISSALLKILTEANATVNWYGGRSIRLLNSEGSVTFNDLYSVVFTKSIHCIEVMTEIDRLEKQTQDTNVFQDIGTFFRRLPDRISIMVRQILCYTVFSKTQMRNSVYEDAINRRIEEAFSEKKEEAAAKDERSGKELGAVPTDPKRFFDVLFYGSNVAQAEDEHNLDSEYCPNDRIKEICKLGDAAISELVKITKTETLPLSTKSILSFASQKTGQSLTIDPKILFQFGKLLLTLQPNNDQAQKEFETQKVRLALKYFEKATKLGSKEAAAEYAKLEGDPINLASLTKHILGK